MQPIKITRRKEESSHKETKRQMIQAEVATVNHQKNWNYHLHNWRMHVIVVARKDTVPTSATKRKSMTHLARKHLKN